MDRSSPPPSSSDLLPLLKVLLAASREQPEVRGILVELHAILSAHLGELGELVEQRRDLAEVRAGLWVLCWTYGKAFCVRLSGEIMGKRLRFRAT